MGYKHRKRRRECPLEKPRTGNFPRPPYIPFKRAPGEDRDPTWLEKLEIMDGFNKALDDERKKRRRERTFLAVNMCAYVSAYVSAYSALFSFVYPFRSRLVGNRIRCTLGVITGFTCYTAWYVRKNMHTLCEE